MTIVLFLPGFSGGRLQLVDPGFVNIHRVGVDAKIFVINDVFDNRRQKLPQGVVASRASVEADHHLDDSGISRHDVLNLVNLRPGDTVRKKKKKSIIGNGKRLSNPNLGGTIACIT